MDEDFEAVDKRVAPMQGYEPAIRRCARCDAVIPGVACFRPGKTGVEMLCLDCAK